MRYLCVHLYAKKLSLYGIILDRPRHCCVSVAIGRMKGQTTPLLRVCSNSPHGRRRRDASPSARLGVARSLQTDGRTQDHQGTLPTWELSPCKLPFRKESHKQSRRFATAVRLQRSDSLSLQRFVNCNKSIFKKLQKCDI